MNEMSLYQGLLRLFRAAGDEGGVKEAEAEIARLRCKQSQQEVVELAQDAEEAYERLYSNEYSDARRRPDRKAPRRENDGTSRERKKARRARMDGEGAYWMN